MAAGKSKHQGGPTRPLRRGQRPFVDLDPADSLLLRQISEKAQVCIIQLHNLNAEIQTLKEEQKKLTSAVLTLLSDPQAREDAVAVLKDFHIQKKKEY